MGLIKKLFYLLVISFSITGLYFSIIGWMRFTEKRTLFFIAIYSCCIGALIGIFEIITFKKRRYFDFHRVLLGLLGGIALILASIYLLSIPSTSLVTKLIAGFGILFFGFCIIKGIANIKIEHRREIIVSLEYNDAFEKSKEILKATMAKIIEEKKDKGRIIATTKLSWKSFGEELIINLERLDE